MAFERLKAFIRRGGFTTESLNTPADHPKVGIDHREYNRLLGNMRVYGGKFDPVVYYDAKGHRQTRPFVPLNIVKFSANWMATLIFNNNCRINIADEAASKYITELFERNNFAINFQQYLEVMFAIGGLAIRPYYSAASNDIKISWCLPDRFFPLESNTGEVSEATIVTKTREVRGKDVFYYSLFEFHEWVETVYTIRHELYESDSPGVVGKRVALNTLDKYATLPERTALPQLTRTQYVYLKPATMNNIEPDSPLGLGFTDNAHHTIDTINVLHDKFRMNIRRSRSGLVIAPESVDVEMENGQMYALNDPDDMFIAVPGAGQGMDADPYKEITIPISPEQFITSINFELRTYEAQNGISPGTFTFDGEGLRAKTAFEVGAEQGMTYQTREKQVMVIGAGLRDLVWSVLELAKQMELYSGNTKPPVTVDFDDGVFQDKASRLEYYLTAKNGKMIPHIEAVKRTFNLTEAEAKKWVDEIQQEESDQLARASRITSDLAFGVPGVDG